MFDFSFSELLIIGVVAVIVLDPRHLPDLARQAGRWVGRARRFMAKMKEDLDQQVGTEHLAPLRELNQEWQRTRALLQDAVEPAEWQEAVGDESPDTRPPTLASSASIPRRQDAGVTPRPRRRRRRPRKPASGSAVKGGRPVGKAGGRDGA